MRRLDEAALLRNPLTVGLVGPLPPPPGGMANQTAQLARLLGEAGIKVEVVRSNAPYRPRWVEKLARARAAFRLLPYLAALWRCAGRVELMHVMANSGWAWHLFAAPAVWIAWLRGTPAIVNYRGGEAQAFFARAHRWLMPTFRRARAIVVPSGFLAAVFADHGMATTIVPNVVDLSRFAPAVGRKPAHHVIVTRNLEQIYDIPTALRAFAVLHRRYPDACLTVAGGGPERRALETLCAELGIAAAVTFTGPMSNERIADLYRDADLMLNPSLADNMPISILEAMASGLPIVSTNVGGIPYLARHGETALLVEPRDAQAMADAAFSVFRRPDLAARLKRNGLEAARRYTWPQVRERLLDVYARAVGRPFAEWAA